MPSIFPRNFLLLSAAVLWACASSSALCQEKASSAESVEGVLVLTNGNILRGAVQQLGKDFVVTVPHGKLQVRGKQVEMVCENLEQAYQRRRAQRDGSSADSHIELAAWCLRQDLFDQAEAELQAARTTNTVHPRLALLERQLKQSRQIALRRSEQQESEAIALPDLAPLDPAALEKAPKWARVLFVRQIQPLIVHSCASTGCHQTSNESVEPGADFHLNRLAIDGAGHPDATLRNLAATLAQIDWENADQSDLLRRAREAHGSAIASAPLPEHKLQVLQGWVEQLAEAHRIDTELKMLPPVPEVAGMSANEGLALNPPGQTISASPAVKTTSNVRQTSFQQTDPFDPAAFNERHASLAQPPAALTVPHVLAPSISSSQTLVAE